MDEKKREHRRVEKIGTVVSDAMNKTRVVFVERTTVHPMYQKRLRQRKKFYAHDEENMSKRGDKVRMQQSRPLSRLKRWRITEIVQHAVKTESGVANGSASDNSGSG